MFKGIRRALDATVARAIRHIFFVLVRPYYGLFYNVSCSNKHLVQDLPGGLVLASHVSRHDGPLVSALLYSTMRVRPAAHYTEYYSWLQWLPLMLAGTIPMSSPRKWSPERRSAQKTWALGIIRRIIENGNLVLLFPAGMVRKQPREVINPKFSGAYDILKAMPETPVVIVHIEGLSRFETPKYDRFWTFLFIKKGRRHVNVHIDVLKDGLDTDCTLAEFNARLERRFNNEEENSQ